MGEVFCSRGQQCSHFSRDHTPLIHLSPAKLRKQENPKRRVIDGRLQLGTNAKLKTAAEVSTSLESWPEVQTNALPNLTVLTKISDLVNWFWRISEHKPNDFQALASKMLIKCEHPLSWEAMVSSWLMDWWRKWFLQSSQVWVGSRCYRTKGDFQKLSFSFGATCSLSLCRAVLGVQDFVGSLARTTTCQT